MNYSEVRTDAEVAELCEIGQLSWRSLKETLPQVAVVGEDCVLLPQRAGEDWERFATTLERCVRQDLVNRVELKPEFRDGSLIPARLHVRATHTQRKGSYEPTLSFW